MHFTRGGELRGEDGEILVAESVERAAYSAAALTRQAWSSYTKWRSGSGQNRLGEGSRGRGGGDRGRQTESWRVGARERRRERGSRGRWRSVRRGSQRRVQRERTAGTLV